MILLVSTWLVGYFHGGSYSRSQTQNNGDETWRAVTAAAPAGVPLGWKNFYRNDTPMLTPTQTMRKQPTPVMISYQ